MELFRFSFRVMGGPGELQLRAESNSHAERLRDTCVHELQRIEKKFSRYDAESIVSRISAAAGEGWTTVDEETSTLLQFASAAFESSHGKFDITSGVLRRVWDFKNRTVPQSSALKEVLPLIGFQKVELRKGAVRLPLKGMELDFGGIGKEYVVDRGIGVLAHEGCTSALLNLAGDLRSLSNKDDPPWKVGIVHPRMSGATVATIELKQSALATSGDYERFFEIDGVRYCHILNPKTGYPVTELQSVSVISPSCLVAGCMTTTAMLLGKGAGRKFLEDSGLPYLIVDANGRELWKLE